MTNSLTLFQLSAEHRALAERLADDGLDEATIADTLDSEAGEIEARAVNIVQIAQSFESLAEAIREQERRMAFRRGVLERRAARIRDYVRDAMQLAGIQKIDCPLFSVSVRENPPSVVVYDYEQLPMLYLREPAPVPDKVAIAAALKAGKDVPGAHLERTTSLRVK